jgi:hypothetical protein
VDYRLYVSLVSDDFSKNQVRCHIEGRFGVSTNQARRGGEGHDRRLMAPRGRAVILVSARLRDLQQGCCRTSRCVDDSPHWLRQSGRVLAR